jgi:uridine monophosphate synthetase
MNFFEALEKISKEKGGPLCVGIDPRIELSADRKSSYEKLVSYGKRVVDAVFPYAAAFKPQLAFFEQHGSSGWDALFEIVRYIRSADPYFPVIFDAKRGDIGSTAEAYAKAFFASDSGPAALTLSPYLGRESVEPFLEFGNAGAFVLCRTTNPGAGIIQEKTFGDGTPLYLYMADEILSWDNKKLGLVVAGNDIEVLAAVRKRHENAWFLAPGIGAQGGSAEEAVAAGARSDGFGVLVSASRSVADAENPAAAAEKLKEELDSARAKFLASKVSGSPAYSIRSSSGKVLSESEKKEFLESFYKTGAFKTGNFTLKSGIKSPFYLDLRRLGSDPEVLKLTGKAYAELINKTDAALIAGIPVAALTLAAAASMETGRRLVYPRLEKKKHGSGAVVEGIWDKGDSAVLLDDLITTGGSKKEAVEVLVQAGIKVTDLVVLVERGRQGRKDMEELGINLYSWISLEEIIQAGIDGGHLDKKTADEVSAFVHG